MKIDILTLFPEMFTSVFSASILGRARQSGILDIALHDIRPYSASKHRSTDDAPFGGGAGMVMTVQPVLDCMDAVIKAGESPRRIYLSPRGKQLSPQLACELAQESHLLLLCGHYEGIDERILTRIDDEISIGDYVLTGGELPAMVLVDCLARFIPNVLGSSESAANESFSDGLLEYPQYTRPANYQGMAVPDILLSGNHAKIETWRRQQALLLTRKMRPDLFEKLTLSAKDIKFLREYDVLCEENPPEKLNK